MEKLQNVFNPSAKKCGCLGTGWFDAGRNDAVNWVTCPYHQAVWHPETNPVEYEELCNRLYDELHKE